jgi:hypothetical protein
VGGMKKTTKAQLAAIANDGLLHAFDALNEIERAGSLNEDQRRALVAAQGIIIDVLLQSVSPVAVIGEFAKEKNADNAKKPRRDIMTKAEIDAKVDSYCRHMIAIGDLPGNPGWTKTLAQWAGEHGEHRAFKQWRDFARHLKERRIDKAQMLETLKNWKPKGR